MLNREGGREASLPPLYCSGPRQCSLYITFGAGGGRVELVLAGSQGAGFQPMCGVTVFRGAGRLHLHRLAPKLCALQVPAAHMVADTEAAAPASHLDPTSLPQALLPRGNLGGCAVGRRHDPLAFRPHLVAPLVTAWYSAAHSTVKLATSSHVLALHRQSCAGRRPSLAGPVPRNLSRHLTWGP